MKNVNKITEKAKSYFAPPSLNCAQSVLLALTKDAYEIDDDLVPKIATCFGGGISKQDLICGAFTGALMALGVKYGTSNPEESRAKPYRIAEEFRKRFEKEFGSLYCTKLCGCNLSTREGWTKFRDTNVHEKVCPKYVIDTVEIVMTIIEEESQKQVIL